MKVQINSIRKPCMELLMHTRSLKGPGKVVSSWTGRKQRGTRWGTGTSGELNDLWCLTCLLQRVHCMTLPGATSFDTFAGLGSL